MGNGNCKYWIIVLGLICYARQNASIAEAQNCANITNDYRKSIVHLKVEKTHRTTGAIDDIEGTGFIVDPAGFLITDYHVVSKDDDIDLVKITGALESRNGFHVPIL